MMESKTLPSMAGADRLGEVLRRCDMLRNGSASGVVVDSLRAAMPSRITRLRLTVGEAPGAPINPHSQHLAS
jgi:hypothetical protein